MASACLARARAADPHSSRTRSGGLRFSTKRASASEGEARSGQNCGMISARTREILALLLAADCAGCGTPSTVLCSACEQELTSDPVTVVTPDGLTVRAALTYDGAVARCIRAVKEEGQTMLARPLSDALRAVLRECSGALVPVPTSRAAYRRRGFRVPDLLLRRAGVRPYCVLGVTRQRADQRALGREERRQNVRGSMRARRWRSGTPSTTDVIIVDDVITTGATIDDAARALWAAGYHVRSAVALAATPLRKTRTSEFREK